MKCQGTQGPEGCPPCPGPFSLSGLTDRKAGLPSELLNNSYQRFLTVTLRESEREYVGKMENTVTPRSALLGGQGVETRDKVQRATEVSCSAQSTTISSLLRVKTAHDQLNNY